MLKTCKLNKVINPDRKFIMYVDFKAPSKPGKYHAFFKLGRYQNDQLLEFGDQVVIDLVVGSPDVPELKLDAFGRVMNVPTSLRDSQFCDSKANDEELILANMMKIDVEKDV